MRGFIRTFGRNLFAAAFVVATILAAGAGQAAERRLIVTDSADYPGFDYSTVRDVDLAACEAACLGDPTCRAFTFNTAAGWCFLKSDFAALAATPGAVAGRVVTAVDLTPSLERQRLGELDFLPESAIDESRVLTGELARRYPSDGASYADLRSAGGVSYRGGQYDDAARYFGQALALASEDVASWLDYATASLGRNPDDYSDRMSAATDATAGAINAYLRAEADADRAEALSVVGAALAKREIWREAIRAYRASLAIREVARVRQAYDRLVAEHGFRILSHEVEADSAVPQVCIRFSDSLATARPDLADFVTVEGGDGLAIEPQANQICINGIEHGSRYIVRLRAGLPAADGETLPYP
ncbi:MAG: PAN domain-containing protein, partial [Bauldia sp.]